MEDSKTKHIEIMVEAHCLYNQSILVQEILGDEKGILSFEDTDNFYFKECPDCASYEVKKNIRGEYQCESCNTFFTEEEFDNLEINNREVFEWWLVTGWMADKLRAKGEVILGGLNCFWWGRTTTGQRISMDSVIEQIWIEDNLPL